MCVCRCVSCIQEVNCFVTAVKGKRVKIPVVVSSLSDADSEFGWSEDEISDLHDSTTVIIAADGERSPARVFTWVFLLLSSFVDL